MTEEEKTVSATRLMTAQVMTAQDGNATPVPPLLLETKEDRLRNTEAALRVSARKPPASPCAQWPRWPSLQNATLAGFLYRKAGN
jgi:hypothetical protein